MKEVKQKLTLDRPATYQIRVPEARGTLHTPAVDRPLAVVADLSRDAAIAVDWPRPRDFFNCILEPAIIFPPLICLNIPPKVLSN